LHLTKFWEGVVENPQLTHIVMTIFAFGDL
jgi:hypothetical protein